MPAVRHTSYFDDDDEDSFAHTATKPRAGAAHLGVTGVHGEEDDEAVRHPRHASVFRDPDGGAGEYEKFSGWTKSKLNRKYRQLKTYLSKDYKETYTLLSRNAGWPAHQILNEVREIRNLLKDDQRKARAFFDKKNEAEIKANKAKRGHVSVPKVDGEESLHVRRMRFMHKQYSIVPDLPSLHKRVHDITRIHARHEEDIPLNPVPTDHGNEKYYTSIALSWCFRAIRVIMQSTMQYILTLGAEARKESPDMEKYYEDSTHAETVLSAMQHIRKLVRTGRKPRKRIIDPPLADDGERVRGGD